MLLVFASPHKCGDRINHFISTEVADRDARRQIDRRFPNKDVSPPAIYPHPRFLSPSLTCENVWDFLAGPQKSSGRITYFTCTGVSNRDASQQIARDHQCESGCCSSLRCRAVREVSLAPNTEVIAWIISSQLEYYIGILTDRVPEMIRNNVHVTNFQRRWDDCSSSPFTQTC